MNLSINTAIEIKFKNNLFLIKKKLKKKKKTTTHPRVVA
jgi:hypothetical protein